MKSKKTPKFRLDLLCKALVRRQKALDVSWKTIATDAKISPSTLSRIVAGKSPNLDTFALLLAYLGEPPDNFFSNV